MLAGCGENAWTHTSFLLACLINTSANKDPKKALARPQDFNPYAKKPPSRDLPADITILRDVFIDRADELAERERQRQRPWRRKGWLEGDGGE